MLVHGLGLRYVAINRKGGFLIPPLLLRRTLSSTEGEFWRTVVKLISIAYSLLFLSNGASNPEKMHNIPNTFFWEKMISYALLFLPTTVGYALWVMLINLNSFIFCLKCAGVGRMSILSMSCSSCSLETSIPTGVTTSRCAKFSEILITSKREGL